MNLFGVMDVSGSALRAERVRAEVVASNMANAETTRTPEGGPYQRHHVVFQAQDGGGSFQESLVSHVNAGSGGLLGNRFRNSVATGFGNGLNGGHGAAEVKGAGGLLTGVGAALFLSAGGLAVAAGAGDDEGELLDIEGFGEVIRSSGAHGLHGAGDAALGGHDDDAGFGGEIFIAEQSGAQSIGEIYIDEGEVEALFGGEAAGGGEGADGHDIGAEAFEGDGDLLAEEGLVFQDKDVEAGEGERFHLPR